MKLQEPLWWKVFLVIERWWPLSMVGIVLLAILAVWWVRG